MIVFRLAKQKYCRDLSGKGAELAGGRWNSKGVSMIYTSESRALCLAEIAVHVPIGIVPVDYFLTEIEIPEGIEISPVTEKDLPAGWDAFPHSKTTQEIGDMFILKNEFLILKVPSAVVKGDFNYLINPGHFLFREVKIVKTELFTFDTRLFT
jgi:RES domain-containing protein